MSSTKVMIIMGSDSDMPVMQETKTVLDELGISSKTVISSAHRTPAKLVQLVKEAEKDGVKIFIAGAGMAAHLAGAIAANTVLPVIGVPLDSLALNGIDALLSTVQMPKGIPVATMAIGKHGAKNAGIFAAQILGLSDNKILDKLAELRKEMEKNLETKNKQIV